MNLLKIGLTDKQFEYPKGSLVITDEPILKRGEKLFDPPNTASIRCRWSTERRVNLQRLFSPIRI
jgi:hypothetical protein